MYEATVSDNLKLGGLGN